MTNHSGRDGATPGYLPSLRRQYRHLFLARLWRLGWISLTLSAPGGCQSFSYQTLIENGALHSEVLQSVPFKHRLFKPTRDSSQSDQILHIYIEGDGIPWWDRSFVSPDPTPEHPLMLETMLADPSPSLYLGRPCYFHVDDASCSAADWTMDRYSQSVVESMTAIVEQLAAGKQSLWLIGHSGGGTLAVLIGRRLSRPVNVLTIAANLDHQAWTNYHQYTPMLGSINVASDTVRNSEMKEIHWYGKADNNVLPQWTQAYCQNRQAICLPAEADHSRGWLKQWREILTTAGTYFRPF